MSNDETRVIGDVPEVLRIQTGLYSFDRSLGQFGKMGIPLRSLVELYGPEASGKSTLAYWLAGKVAGPKGIWVADLEGTLDKWYVDDVTKRAGHTGTIRISDYGEHKRGAAKKSVRPHEIQLQEAIDSLLDDEYVAGVADSIGAFVSLVSSAKDLGERSVGQEAKTINDASKRVANWLRVAEDPKLFIYINHTHPNIGGHGFDTPGGRKKKYLSNVRLWIRRAESDVPSGSGNFIAKIKVQKLKYGAAGGESLVYFIPGYGVSREMTAVFDCVEAGSAVRSTTIKMGGESHGYLKTLAKKALEPEKNAATFQPFFDELERLKAADRGQ